jgi:hypothetical protein
VPPKKKKKREREKEKAGIRTVSLSQASHGTVPLSPGYSLTPCSFFLLGT